MSLKKDPIFMSNVNKMCLCMTSEDVSYALVYAHSLHIRCTKHWLFLLKEPCMSYYSPAMFAEAYIHLRHTDVCNISRRTGGQKWKGEENKNQDSELWFVGDRDPERDEARGFLGDLHSSACGGKKGGESPFLLISIRPEHLGPINVPR